MDINKIEWADKQMQYQNVAEQVKVNKDQIEKIKKEQIWQSKDQNQKLNEIYKRLDLLEKYLFTYTEGIKSGIINIPEIN